MVGSSFYISISQVPAVQHGGVKFLYHSQSSTSRLACWDQVFISVSVQYQLSSMVGSSFYISISQVPAVQHAGVKFLYQCQSSTSRLACWGQVFISVSVQYQPCSMLGSSFYISICRVPAVQHGGVKFLYQCQSSTSRLACWGQVFISVSVQYQPSSMVGSSFYISISLVPAVQHAGIKFLYHYQSSISRLAWWGQVFISVSVQYQPSSMVGSSFYISISPVPAVKHGGVKFLYHYQSSTSLAWWGQVFISVSVQYQSSSMLGSSFYITLSPVPAVQHGVVKFLYQCQSSTSRLAWCGQVFISVSVQYPAVMRGSQIFGRRRYNSDNVYNLFLTYFNFKQFIWGQRIQTPSSYKWRFAGGWDDDGPTLNASWLAWTHTGQAEIENERRSKIARNSVSDCHLLPVG